MLNYGQGNMLVALLFGHGGMFKNLGVPVVIESRFCEKLQRPCIFTFIVCDIKYEIVINIPSRLETVMIIY